jgi:cellulose synthase/poly-beta-1,6-N-acetylglucosamine synthase-like glycosyltransferase
VGQIQSSDVWQRRTGFAVSIALGSEQNPLSKGTSVLLSEYEGNCNRENFSGHARYTEKNTIKEIYNTVRAVNIRKEIALVDDCSTDGTRDIICQLEDDTTKVIFHDRNMGKGATLRTGFKNVTGDIVIVPDAGLEYNPGQYPKLIQPILDSKADVVYGSRLVPAVMAVYFSSGTWSATSSLPFCRTCSLI